MPINYNRIEDINQFSNRINELIDKGIKKPNQSEKMIVGRQLLLVKKACRVAEKNKTMTLKLNDFREFLQERYDKAHPDLLLLEGKQIQTFAIISEIKNFFSVLYKFNNTNGRPYLSEKHTAQFLINSFIQIEGESTNDKFTLNINGKEKKKIYALFYKFWEEYEECVIKKGKIKYARILKEHFTNFTTPQLHSITSNMQRHREDSTFYN